MLKLRDAGEDSFKKNLEACLIHKNKEKATNPNPCSLRSKRKGSGKKTKNSRPQPPSSPSAFPTRRGCLDAGFRPD
ncbi:hypothetical protein IEQ34_007638 [Dendrobium chrysotoxum]|uniref:Uncharacterized protein n=1 Tax=Dendrobium chrysotoxum TaxID=161865 RepID=A0AAV7H3K6_DENCH|nr:hypothetical protein IEQ34_007638 [Dendrobium chrysotoxum]